MSSDSDNEPIETTSDVTPTSTKASPTQKKKLNYQNLKKVLQIKLLKNLALELR